MTTTSTEQRLRELVAKRHELQEAGIEIRWERVASPTAGPALFQKTGRAFNPRSNEELQSLYRGYKKLYESALIHLNQLKQHESDVREFLDSNHMTQSQWDRAIIQLARVTQDIEAAEEGLAYLRGRMEKWKAYVDRAGHGPVDVEGAFPDSHAKLARYEQFLTSDAKRLTEKRLRDMLQEAEKIRDIANYEARQLSRQRREKQANSRDNEKYWRQAQRQNLNTSGYVSNDQALASEIRDLQAQIHKQKQKAARAERLVRNIKNRLRQGKFASAHLHLNGDDNAAYINDDDDDDDDNGLMMNGIEPAGVSLVPKRLKRLRKKKQARSHEKQAKREARKARKARQDEIRLREQPLQEKEKKLSNELKQAKKREREIKRKEKELIKQRRRVRRERKKLRKQRRRAGKKKVVASSLGQAIESLPSQVVANMVQAGNSLQQAPLQDHHEDAADDALEDASHALLALAQAAIGSHWVWDNGDGYHDDYDYDGYEYDAYESVPTALGQGLVDWVESWGEVFRPFEASSAAAATAAGGGGVMATSPSLARGVHQYAGEQVSDLLARHPMAVKNAVIDAWDKVQSSFRDLLLKAGKHHAFYRSPPTSGMPLAVAERQRTAAAAENGARMQCMDALAAWAKSLRDAVADGH